MGDRKEEVPVIVMCCDANGDFFALSVYNTEFEKLASAVTPMKTVLKIKKPKFRLNSLIGPDGKECSYPSVRVAHPGDLSVFGGASLVSVATQSKFSPGAKYVEPCTDDGGDDLTRAISSKAKEADADATPGSGTKAEKKVDERW